jgi:hypothetical protein
MGKQDIMEESKSRSTGKNNEIQQYANVAARLAGGALPGALTSNLGLFDFVGGPSLVSPAHAAPRFCRIFTCKMTARTLAEKCDAISSRKHTRIRGGDDSY